MMASPTKTKEESVNLNPPSSEKKGGEESPQTTEEKGCQSIYGLTPSNFETPYPFDIYDERRKAKPPSASFYERLRDLRDADRIFVKPATKSIIRYIDLKCQFEVLNSQGEPIYFALDTTDAWASTVFEIGIKPYNVMILDYDYSEVLKITGPGFSRQHGHANVKHSGKEIGKIVQDDRLLSFSPTYSIHGTNDVLGLKVVGPPDSYTAAGLPETPVFNVYLPDELTLLGRICKRWLLFSKSPEDETTAEETYMIDFHQNMDLRTKCLILSIVFMVDYQFYHKVVQGGVSRKCWAWFSVLFFSLVTFILVAVGNLKKYHITTGNGDGGMEEEYEFSLSPPTNSAVTSSTMDTF